MISNPRKKCIDNNCKQVATYGLHTQNHCELHKTIDEVYLVERKCSKCNNIDVLINDICVNFCSMVDKAIEIRKYQKLKEKRIVQLLTTEYREPDEYNKRVQRICGNKNSEEKEICYDFKTHIVYIEVDEHQHKSYCDAGEINRMKNIYMDEGGCPVVFIRYNPDNCYLNKKKCDIPQYKKETELIKFIKYYENFDNIKYNLSVNYLYYDDTYNTNYEFNL